MYWAYKNEHVETSELFIDGVSVSACVSICAFGVKFTVYSISNYY